MTGCADQAQTQIEVCNTCSPAKSQETFVINPHDEDRLGHTSFPDIPRDLIKVSTKVRINRTIDHGLNFFAIQSNFPNKTWAHGGPQMVNGRHQINWGGLVNRGGGSRDYQETNPPADLMLMQNGPDSERSAPYQWEPGREYVITIERGAPVIMPQGEYIFIGKGPKVFIPETRKMWTWIFTIKPADGQGEEQKSRLFNTADRIESIYIWNECGYGSCGQGQSATWSLPSFVSLSNPQKEMHAKKYNRF